MKIKAVTGVAGEGYTFRKGGEYDVSDELGKELVGCGHAIELKTEERAKIAPTENAKARREGNKGK